MNRIGLAACVAQALCLLTLVAERAATAQTLLPCPLGYAGQGGRADWLVRRDEPSCRTGLSLLLPQFPVGGMRHSASPAAKANSERTLQDDEDAFGTPRCSQELAYGLEFGGAAVGTCIAAAGAFASYRAFGGNDQLFKGLLIAYPTYAFTSGVLSAAGTHLVGRSFGHGRSLSYALAGGVLGGLAGGALLVVCFLDYEHKRALWPLGLFLPPFGAVAAYNWRNDD